MNINKSASKVVFLAIASTICLAYGYEVFKGLAILETKDFMLLAGAVFGYYFGAPSAPTEPVGISGK